MKIAKELLIRPITVVDSNGVTRTNRFSDARFLACNARSFMFYYFADIELTQASAKEAKEYVDAFKSKIPDRYKEVSNLSELEENTYYVEIRHPTRPAIEPDMSCISFTFDLVS